VENDRADTWAPVVRCIGLIVGDLYNTETTKRQLFEAGFVLRMLDSSAIVAALKNI
jgi:hypothetical protein